MLETQTMYKILVEKSEKSSYALGLSGKTILTRV
jgi:hypothetical protein